MRRYLHAFTFVEALAALLVTSIVLPIALQGILVANRASLVNRRSEQAAHLASMWLSELVLTGDWQTTETVGDFEDWPGYTWELTTEDWEQGEVDSEGSILMTELTLTVQFEVQNRVLDVSVSTLVGGEEL